MTAKLKQCNQDEMEVRASVVVVVGHPFISVPVKA